jgi:hypothetical protein
VRSHLSFRSKRELLLQIAPRYKEASSALKTVILDEFVAATGYARKYAIRLLSQPVAAKLKIERPRSPRYGPEVQQALHLAWTAANHICAKRLIPFLPTLVESASAAWTFPSERGVSRPAPLDESGDRGSDSPTVPQAGAAWDLDHQIRNAAEKADSRSHLPGLE